MRDYYPCKRPGGSGDRTLRLKQLARLTAFTLTEMLIGLGLIVVIASLLLPAINKSNNAARMAQCVSNLRQIGAAMNLYVADHQNNFPAANGLDNIQPILGWKGLWYMPTTPADGALVPYVGGQAALDRLVVCPTNHFPTAERPPIKNPIGYPYTANYNVLVAAGTAQPKNRLQFTNPSQIFLIADAASAETPNSKWGLGVQNPTAGAATLENRHTGQMNVLWMDGRVSSGPMAIILKNENFKN